MKILKLILLVFVLSLCALTPIFGQERILLLDSIESSLSSSLPDLPLKHKHREEQTADFIFGSPKSFVFVWLEFGDSVERARGIFSSQVHVARNHGFDVKVPDERLSNLGFDNYWSEDVKEGKRGLHFYRGKVAVLVTAPSNEIAEMVARQIDALLPDA